MLHASDTTRSRNGFEGLRNAAARGRFYAETNWLIAGLDFSVVARATLKQEYLARHELLDKPPLPPVKQSQPTSAIS